MVSDKCHIHKINYYTSHFSPKSSHVLLLSGSKVHFTEKKKFETVLYDNFWKNFNNDQGKFFFRYVFKTKELQNYNCNNFYFRTFSGNPFYMITICVSIRKTLKCNLRKASIFSENWNFSENLNGLLDNFSRRGTILTWKVPLES